ncbi:MAG: hypothetical protein H0V04_04145 [Chloroflexi bacterium]|nr:hypothetical protein [Chloroflexota bacterium]
MVAPAVGHDGTDHRSTDAVRADYLRPGDRVFDHGIGVFVPPRGETVWGELKFEDGTSQTLQVETTLDGAVRIYQFGDELADRSALLASDEALAASAQAVGPETAGVDATSASSLAECNDRANNLYSWRTPKYQWRYASGTTPSKFRNRSHGQRAVINSIKRAVQNVTGEDNVCSRGDRISATKGYLGTTSRRPGVTSNGYCSGKADGRSVIGFGDLPSRSIAVACVRTSSGRTYDGDIKISWHKAWETRRSWCSGRELMIEAGMTHEFGHIFGLAHVSSSSSWSLTMQPIVNYCTMGHATLGLGDMLGLERKY